MREINSQDFVSNRVIDMPFSGIRKFFDIASEMDDVISLGVGEPDFDTPWNVRERAMYTLEKGKTVYTSNAGLLSLREEISKYYNRKYNVSYNSKSEVLVTVGASEGIDVAFRTLINPGDEVLVVEPSFVCYKPCITMAGGVPVVIETKVENEFKLTAQEILDKITDKTKILVLPYPNNPTGGVMDKSDLEAIAKVIEEKNLFVVSDEIYSELTYGEQKHVSIASLEGMRDRCVVINGFSKAFAMTGWRLGYALGPEAVIKQMTKVHQYAIMCAPTISQFSAVEALKNCDGAVENMKKEYDSRRRLMLKGFRDMGLECFEALGAFYLFPCIKSTGLSSDEFCERLLFEQKVAVVPGTAFGECGEGFIRCSYAYSIEEIKTALKEIAKFVEKIR